MSRSLFAKPSSIALILRKFHQQSAGMHISVMYVTPADRTDLFHSIILTNPIVEYMSHAKPRRESYPKLVLRFPFRALLQVTAPLNCCCNVAQNGVYKPALCQKKARFCWCWVHYIKTPPGFWNSTVELNGWWKILYSGVDAAMSSQAGVG